jgi:hypothetical protein
MGVLAATALALAAWVFGTPAGLVGVARWPRCCTRRGW